MTAFYVTLNTELLFSQFWELEMKISIMDAKLVGKIGLKRQI